MAHRIYLLAGGQTNSYCYTLVSDLLFWIMARWMIFACPSGDGIHLSGPGNLTYANYKSAFLHKVYSRLPLKQTQSGPALTVRLREVSALGGDEVDDWSMAGTNVCFRGVCFNKVSPCIINCSFTCIRAHSASIAACVTPSLFLFRAFTTFTPSLSLNLPNQMRLVLNGSIIIGYHWRQ